MTRPNEGRLATPPAGRFVAWTREPPSRRWEPVAAGDTEAEARVKVFDIPARGKMRDVCVLPAGVDPNRPRPAA
ncbi:MAG: hypothetical protein HYS12_02495 [Planctomycetes bacterium]|nr:hypothetical protein [Planctomycetota bacterium]